MTHPVSTGVGHLVSVIALSAITAGSSFGWDWYGLKAVCVTVLLVTAAVSISLFVESLVQDYLKE